MAAVQETIDQVKKIDVDQYKYGFETRIESVKAPKGLDESTVRLHLGQEGRARVAFDLASRSVPALEGDDRADVGEGSLSEDRFSGHLLLFGAEIDGRAEEPRRRRSATDRDVQEARHSAEGAGSFWRACRRSRVAVDAVFDSVSVVTTFKDELAKAGVIFCSISEAVREHPELVKKYLGSVVPQSDNYYAALNAAVYSDGSFVYVPRRRAMPDGAFDLFPHEREGRRASSSAR